MGQGPGAEEFPMSMTFCPLYSGSSGNAIYVATERTRLLIDAGLSGKTIISALASIGVNPASLNGILVTHEHTDHVKGAGILSRKFDIPIYATEDTWQAMEMTIGPVRSCNMRGFDKAADFFVQDINVVPFGIPHDAADPVGYRLFNGGFSVATATDLGHFTKELLSQLSGADVVLLESNHDPEMLMANIKYSHTLKRRILGNRGHLSNEDCARAAAALCETGVRHIVLGHLSGENNVPALAYEVTKQTLAQAGIDANKDVGLNVASRHEVGGVYTICDQAGLA